MPAKTELPLTAEQRAELVYLRDHAPKPYIREKAAALIKVADGQPVYKVAQYELLKPRKPDTVTDWVERYQAEGVKGLYVRKGRGRKPAFSPLAEEAAAAQVEWVLHQSPRQYGMQRVRWRLQDVGRALVWLQGHSDPGIYKVLKRLGFSRKRALNFIRSPDPEYRAKWEAILRAFWKALDSPGRVIILFLDELTYYRRPSKAPAYHRRGKTQPLAHEVPRSNTQTRIVAVLNGITGRVTYLQRSKIGKEALVAFYAQVRAAYPQAEAIYIVQDNWPTHKVPEVQAALDHHHLTPLFLPTYASWLNPIEKLWRWLKQDVLHLHRLADALDTLRQQVLDFLDQFATGSDALLRYVGLLPD